MANPYPYRYQYQYHIGDTMPKMNSAIYIGDAHRTSIQECHVASQHLPASTSTLCTVPTSRYLDSSTMSPSSNASRIRSTWIRRTSHAPIHPCTHAPMHIKCTHPMHASVRACVRACTHAFTTGHRRVAFKIGRARVGKECP